MTANDDLIEWNTHWRLAEGIVSCKACQAQQRETDRATPFSHHPGCGEAARNGLPWDQLDTICHTFKHGGPI
ncbi:hypothetical protein K9857_11340 [Pseudomonas sp. REP124]|uniref:hypothetical protein n=1 Tax=Pseudomonas sp. REP124 TaxID=2875731 RepID=UPI001CC9531D|nr:hypothetical protein [Pseudomonas sp. REP124]MBZ9782136.1 hypothetical protein [Pseudomonas sp. REP124]